MFCESGAWRSVWYFYFGVIWNWILLETLTIEVDVSTTFHDIAFEVFILVDITSLTGYDNLGRGGQSSTLIDGRSVPWVPGQLTHQQSWSHTLKDDRSKKK